MPFTGNEDHSISLNDAANLTRNFRETATPGTTLSGYFSKTGINKLLNQSGCVGIRIYYAKADDGKPAFVLVGANAAMDDLYNGEIAQHSIDCPPFCPHANPLNS